MATVPAGKPPKKRPTKKRPSSRRLPPPTVNVRVNVPRQEQPLVPAPVEALEAIDVDSRSIEDVEQLMLGQLGLNVIPFSEHENAVLDEDVPLARVRFLPQRVPVPYLPWPEYVRLFNRAFKRGNWAMVPASSMRPDAAGKQVLQFWVLHVHGRPAAAALGQQEWHANNKDQSLGDAAESTVAIAMRRCAKRLGVWLELYDPDWRERVTRELATYVTVEVNGEERGQWRRKDDPPFYNEKHVGGPRRSSGPAPGRGDNRPPKPEPPRQTPAAHNPDGDQVISEAAVRQLESRIERMARPIHEVLVWLPAAVGASTISAIKRRDYDFVLRSIEKPGPLPLPAKE